MKLASASNAAVALLTAFGAMASEWSYDDMSTWGDPAGSVCLDTSSKAQSPIDIVLSEVSVDPSIAESFSCRLPETLTGKLINNNKTVEFETEDGYECTGVPGLEGETFKLAQFHFHWGLKDGDQGSEHAIDGNFYPIEVHFVHYNTKYGDPTSATPHPDGLMVIGMLFDVSKEGNPVLDEIIARDPAVLKGDKAQVEMALSVKDLMTFPNGDIFTESKKFYTWPGSLTTPPCTESVTWILAKEIGAISRGTLERFRLAKPVAGVGGPLGGNVRPVQGRNGRTITASFQGSGAGKQKSAGDSGASSTLPDSGCDKNKSGTHQPAHRAISGNYETAGIETINTRPQPTGTPAHKDEDATRKFNSSKITPLGLSDSGAVRNTIGGVTGLVALATVSALVQLL